MKTLDPVDIRFFKQTNKATKQPKETPRDIAICCPICKEGNSWNRKQRCHLYIKDSYDKPMVNCFNCGYHSTLEKYLAIVDSGLSTQYKREKFKDKIQGLKKEEKSNIIIEKESDKRPSVFLDLEQLPFKKHTKPVKEYLKSRGLEKFEDMFFYCDSDVMIEGKFLPIKNSIITPLLYRGRLYGFQARKLDTKMFITFIPDKNNGFKAWNYFNLDLNKPIFIFESVFDALSSGLDKKNITSALGSDFSMKLLKNIKYPIFAFDNQYKDNTSRQKSINLLKQGYHIVLWDKNDPEKDYNELLKRLSFSEIKDKIKSGVTSGLKGVVKLEL
jgi:hypothetical protein